MEALSNSLFVTGPLKTSVKQITSQNNQINSMTVHDSSTKLSFCKPNQVQGTGRIMGSKKFTFNQKNLDKALKANPKISQIRMSALNRQQEITRVYDESLSPIKNTKASFTQQINSGSRRFAAPIFGSFNTTDKLLENNRFQYAGSQMSSSRRSKSHSHSPRHN